MIFNLFVKKINLNKHPAFYTNSIFYNIFFFCIIIYLKLCILHILMAKRLFSITTGLLKMTDIKRGQALFNRRRNRWLGENHKTYEFYKILPVYFLHTIVTSFNILH